MPYVYILFDIRGIIIHRRKRYVRAVTLSRVNIRELSHIGFSSYDNIYDFDWPEALIWDSSLSSGGSDVSLFWGWLMDKSGNLILSYTHIVGELTFQVMLRLRGDFVVSEWSTLNRFLWHSTFCSYSFSLDMFSCADSPLLLLHEVRTSNNPDGSV